MGNEEKRRARPSDVVHSSPNETVNIIRSGILQGAGVDTQRLKQRPLIAIANSHSELTTGHAHLAGLAQKVKEGVLAAGGECAEFNVPAPCDGLAASHDGMNYVLAQRDLIADIVETHVRSQAFDGVVFIAGCDKINPAMMMAMARLDLPSLYLAGGPGQWDIRNAPEFSGSVDYTDYLDDPANLKRAFTCASCGACEMMATANTFQSLSEALGICLPGSANIPAWHSDKLVAARATGERIVDMVWEGLNALQILTADALHNAAVAGFAIGGSTNLTLHLPAIADAAGVAMDHATFAALEKVPTLLSISPNGPYGVQDLWAAGGMTAVLKVIAPLLKTDCLTVTGHPLSATLEKAQIFNPKVIPSLDNPKLSEASIAILYGNLAPDGAVIKRSAVRAERLKFTATAKRFDTEDDALAAIQNKEVTREDAIVLPYQGPKGSPGMPEMAGLVFSLKTAGLADCALITDGRFSGSSSGPSIGHICPEAADGGMIAFVQDGDLIDIDIPGGKIHLQIGDEELARRKEGWVPLEKPTPHGYMQRYRNHVGPASKGAILN